jgi:hypothetical protein
MQKIIAGFFMTLACVCAHAAESISMQAAVEIAEQFVAKNGYTNGPASDTKAVLDNEAIERTADPRDQLKLRFNTLLPKAIGAKKGRKNSSEGWSVAFDYTSESGSSNICRVVTMNSAGNDIRIEHVDGIRSYFIGFTPPR